MSVKEPRWIIGCMGLGGKRLAPFAKVTRAEYRRALREARREALLSAAEESRECAREVKEAAKTLDAVELRNEYGMTVYDADHWDETALWLEARAEAKARA